jgi:hypothetical protein
MEICFIFYFIYLSIYLSRKCLHIWTLCGTKGVASVKLVFPFFSISSATIFSSATYSFHWFCYVVYNSLKFYGYINCTVYFVIHICCDNTRKVRRQAFGSATNVLVSWKENIWYENTIFAVNLSSVENVWVEYHAAESPFYLTTRHCSVLPRKKRKLQP